MNRLARKTAEPPSITLSAPPADDSPRHQLRDLLGAVLAPVSIRHERRREKRLPYPKLLKLTPVLGDDATPAADPMMVVGMDISEVGIGFYHQQPIPYRRAVLELEDSSGNRLSLLARLDWCRFTCQGWYISGGRFLEVVAPRKDVPLPAELTPDNPEPTAVLE